MVFSFSKEFIEKAPFCVQQSPFTTVHTAYFNIFCSLMFYTVAAVDTSESHSEIENHIQRLKEMANELLRTLKD